MGIERGTDNTSILLREDPETKHLYLPTRDLTLNEQPGDCVVNLCKHILAASPDWYNVTPTTFVKDGDTIYLLYFARMTDNIRTYNDCRWFPIKELPSIQGRIVHKHLKLVTVGINHGNTR